MTLMNPFKSIVLCIAVALAVTARAGQNFASKHSQLEREWLTALPVQVSGPAYIYSGPALEVIGVECDGKSIEGQIEAVVVRNVATTYPVGAVAIYYVDLRDFSSGIWEGGNQVAGKMRRFQVPASAKVIKVTYRGHSSTGQVSEVATLTSYDAAYLSAQAASR